MRELYRLHGPRELEGLTVDLVVNARAGCDSAPWAELEREFVDCLSTVRRRLRAAARRQTPATGSGARPRTGD
jgi:hypothetical protein